MASYVVKLKEKTAFWTGNSEAVWSDKLEEAKIYSKKSEAEGAIGTEIPTYYELEAVDPSTVVQEEPATEE